MALRTLTAEEGMHMFSIWNHSFTDQQSTPVWRDIIHQIDELEDGTGDPLPISSAATIGAILRDNLRWIMSNASFTPHQKSAASAISACHTSQIGGFLQFCPKCQKYVSYQYGSCNNRNCPQCQFTLQKKWCMLRKSEIIPGVPYYHIVLTLPHELNPLVQANEKLMLNNLFHSSSQSVLQMCRDPQILGATPGIISALHTWSSELLPHYHVHMLVTGGGLDKNGTFVNLVDLRKSQKNSQDKHPSKLSHSSQDSQQTLSDTDSREPEDDSYTYFMPLRALTDLFRGIFLAEMMKMYSKHKIVIPESLIELEDPLAWNSFCHNLFHMSWVGHLIKSFGPEADGFERMGHYMTRSPLDENKIVSYDNLQSAPHDSNSDVIGYLGRFVSATAITSNRITDYSQKTVTFLAREKNGTGYHKSITLGVHAFIARFLSHILPKGFGRIRCYGFLSNSQKKKSLASIFKQVMGNAVPDSELKNARGRELVQLLFPDYHFGFCPHCHSALKTIAFGNCPPWLARGQTA